MTPGDEAPTAGLSGSVDGTTPGGELAAVPPPETVGVDDVGLVELGEADALRRGRWIGAAGCRVVAVSLDGPAGAGAGAGCTRM